MVDVYLSSSSTIIFEQRSAVNLPSLVTIYLFYSYIMIISGYIGISNVLLCKPLSKCCIVVCVGSVVRLVHASVVVVVVVVVVVI